MAVMQTNQNRFSMPPQSVALLEKEFVSQPWWRFFYGLFTRSQATIPSLVDTGLTAAGSTQADAFQLVSQWNVLGTVAAGSGVLLPAFGIGFGAVVFNRGANALNIYPATGVQIDALGANNPYSLAATKMQVFYQTAATQWYSTQLG